MDKEQIGFFRYLLTAYNHLTGIPPYHTPQQSTPTVTYIYLPFNSTTPNPNIDNNAIKISLRLITVHIQLHKRIGAYLTPYKSRVSGLDFYLGYEKLIQHCLIKYHRSSSFQQPLLQFIKWL